MACAFLKGNLSDGYELHGPYRTFAEAFHAHDGDEGWCMEFAERDDSPNNKTLDFDKHEKEPT